MTGMVAWHGADGMLLWHPYHRPQGMPMPPDAECPPPVCPLQTTLMDMSLRVGATEGRVAALEIGASAASERQARIEGKVDHLVEASGHLRELLSQHVADQAGLIRGRSQTWKLVLAAVGAVAAFVAWIWSDLRAFLTAISQ